MQCNVSLPTNATYICLSRPLFIHRPAYRILFSISAIPFLCASIFVVPVSVSLIFHPFADPLLHVERRDRGSDYKQKKKIARNLRLPSEIPYLPSAALFLMNSGMNLLQEERIHE